MCLVEAAALAVEVVVAAALAVALE